jgi:hypothetical protein
MRGPGSLAESSSLAHLEQPLSISLFNQRPPHTPLSSIIHLGTSRDIRQDEARRRLNASMVMVRLPSLLRSTPPPNLPLIS